MQAAGASSARFSRREVLAYTIGVGLVAAALWTALCATPRYDWNAARLLPAFVLAAGERIYSAPGTGPALGWIYGPLMPLVMMPATWWPSLTAAMLAAAALNAACLLLPVWLGVNAVARGAGLSFGRRGWLWLLALGGTVAVPWIANSLVFLVSDNLVVGLVLASCLCLARARDGTRLAWWSAMLVALAVWTKQLAIGVPVAQLWWIASTAGTRAALRHSARLLAAGLTLAALAVAIFGRAELLYNLWTVPSGHPLRGDARQWFVHLGRLALSTAPWIALWLALRIRHRAAHPAGALVAVVAITQLPLGALGATKLGGGDNSFHSIYYAAAAFWLELAAAQGPVAAWIHARLRPLALVAGIAALLAIVGLAGWRLAPAGNLEASRALAAAHPGEIHFPRNPLVTWWTERKIYHFEYGLFDQMLAGHPPTAERLHAWLPPRLRYLAYQDDPVDHPFVRLLSDPQRTIRPPGFVIYEIAAPSARAAGNEPTSASVGGEPTAAQTAP